MTAIRATQRTGGGVWGGRAVSVQLSGWTVDGRSSASTVTGNRFRSVLGLRSTYFGFTKG